ncbi:MAG TPA: serine hydrolase [Caulobacteraceae bacterium]|nr:serine hydrolase [Caulobacteraceae bacterium]
MKLLGVLLGAVTLGGCVLERPLRVATGDVAHVLCAETFVAGRDPDVIFKDYIARMPVINRLAPRLRYRVDRTDREVMASFAGHFESRAAYAEGRGCTILHGPGRPAPISLGPGAGFAPDPLAAPADPVTPADPRIAAALERAMAEPGGGVHLDTKAIVIVHDGRIVGERYAPGYGPMTPMLSWSVAKSPINALIGVLVRQGRLSLAGPAPVAAWRDSADPHHDITLEQLLRQTSGQPFGSSNSGFDRSTQMQFLYPDTAAYAERAAFVGKPGERWSYTDGNYAILSDVVRQAVGGSPQDVARFAHRELFGPLGMTTMTMEFDEAGNPMGATYMWASARDWARFALPYLDDGVVDGRRILPAGWAEWSGRPTPQSAEGYGAGFWTNRGDDPNAAGRRALGAPPDSFFANGNYDQTILISPTEHLIIARFGFSQDPDQKVGAARISRLAGEVVRALHTPA